MKQNWIEAYRRARILQHWPTAWKLFWLRDDSLESTLMVSLAFNILQGREDENLSIKTRGSTPG